jgi:PAS domain S-box-containing protein
MDRWPSYVEKFVYAGQLLALAVVYVALAKLGMMIIPVGEFETLIWPPAGVSLAALVLGGYRLWPGIAVGALAANLWLGAPPLVACAIAVGNTLEAVVGTFALRSIPGFRSSLDRLIDVVELVVLAGVASAVISATVGAASLTLGGIIPATTFARSWLMWWMGDLIGILILAPVLLTWAQGPRVARRPAVLVEAATLGSLLVAGAVLVFSQRPETVAQIPILQPYVLFLPLIWAALRFGPLGAATGMFVVAVAAVWGTCTDHGAFVRIDRTDSLFALYVFLTSASLSSLVLGAVVSERERSQINEATVQASEAQLRLAVEAAHLGMWFWDVKKDSLVWTPLCRSMHGLGPDEEVSYARFLSTLHPDDRERIKRAVKSALEEHAEYRIEYRVVWPDGDVHWIDVLGSASYDASGEPEQMQGAAMDITAQQRAEQERADALLREQAARAEAQAATRAKDEFLAVLSHELRTPLQSMLGWTQLLKARRFDEGTVRRVAETIERNVTTQTRLIEDLLDVSRIVAGKLRLERRRVDLVRVVESALESARGAANAKSIQLDAMIEPMDGEVLGDPERLQQVVSNLLGNAVKFTQSRGRIGVQLERESAAARIVVEDTGHGISKEFLPHVFDRFRQSASVTMRSQGGLGLGLAIVRHLVELHGGTVTAESPGEGQGATFTVTLPLVSPEQRAVAPEVKTPPRNGSSTPLLAGVRVLVVDDDLDACELLEAVFHEAGADVHAVQSVRAALDELESWNPHLLVSDIGMPEEDGYDLIRQVRAREAAEGGHAAAIALTAFASPADREQALALGFDAHSAKPASPGDLTTLAARLLGRTA